MSIMVGDWLRYARGAAAVGLIVSSGIAGLVPTINNRSDSLMLRGRAQTLHLYGAPGGDPVVVSSGDGGWIHLGPHVADVLARNGFFVVGFDAKAYLESFTSPSSTLRPEDEPADYRALAQYAARNSSRKPILVGVSEGAGLSVLAASEPATKRVIGGVVSLGLTDRNELGWRWKDAVIYVTHGAPNEPSFSAASLVSSLTPLPLAAIHSTHDEFAPAADAQHTIDRAGEPKRLWMVEARDHRFSDNQAEFDRRLLEAMAWVRANEPR